ncbi:MAG: LysM peptidoglycan-binding domain-containing protein [Schaedlerella sp.]|nr:LysM peptidoglycan-binding domain-containing protein [Schaedlerella sp.]
MERQLPKNVRQIGNVSDTPKIYVEDYVDTFFTQLCEKTLEEPVGAFLIGDFQNTLNEDYIYIYGAIQMHDLKMSGTEYILDEEVWKHAYEDCKQYFEEGEMLGWFIACPNGLKVPDNAVVRLHKKSFPKENTVLIMRDANEKEESYFVHKFDDLMEIHGHYTYYEKNPSMQNYMIATRKKNGVSPTETMEDRAAQDFRSIVRSRESRSRRKRTNHLMYTVSACLVLIIIVMGVVMVNNFDKMRSVQTALNDIMHGSETVTMDEETVEANANIVSAEFSDENEKVQMEEEQESVTGVQEGEEDESAQGDSDINGSDGVYVVEAGDTLAIISRKMYGDISHVDNICAMNGLEDGNLIYVGQKLLLP